MTTSTQARACRSLSIFLLICSSGLAAAATLYTNKTQFLNAAGAGSSSLNTFNDLDYYGLTPDPLVYQIGDNPAYTISSPPFGYAFADNGAVMSCDNSPGLLIEIPAGAAAVGANIHLEDANYNPRPAKLHLDLSDGTSLQIWVTNTTDFVGFVASGALITSLLASYPDNDWLTDPGAALYPTLDNLYVVAGTVALPQLTIARSNNAVIISWPAPSTGFVLQQTTVLRQNQSSSWTASGCPIADDGTVKRAVITAPTGSQFFRLVKAF